MRIPSTDFGLDGTANDVDVTIDGVIFEIDFNPSSESSTASRNSGGTVTIAQVVELLEHVRYRTTIDSPNTTARTVNSTRPNC